MAKLKTIKAAVSGSFNELNNKIRSAVNDKFNTGPSPSGFWIEDVIPDTPVTSGKAVFSNYQDDKYYEAPFTVDESGNITLSDAVNVEQQINYEVIKYARAEGSYEYITGLVADAIRKGLSANQYVTIAATYPDHVIAQIETEDPVTYNWNYQIFNIPYTMDEQGNVTLGDATPAKEVKTYEALKDADIGFVSKDDAKRLVTGPVMIPGCPDCDYAAGEKIFTVDEVADMCHAYNTKFRLADKMHVYGITGETIGESVENWTLKEPMTVKNVLGEEKSYPIGTWMSTTKVSDDETWNQIETGVLKGFSGTYLSEKDADKLLESISANKNNKSYLELISSIKRTLIADLDNPVPVTVSIVDNPCVYDAIFTSIKSGPLSLKNRVLKAGRTISDATYTELKTLADSISALIKVADDERSKNPIKRSMEVDDMDEKELAALVGKTFDEKLNPINEKIEAIEKRLPAELEPTEPPAAKTEGDGDGNSEPTEPDESMKAVQKELEALKEDNEALKKKLGLPVESQKLEGQDGNSNPAKKSDADFYKDAGLKMNGRPLEN